MSQSPSPPESRSRSERAPPSPTLYERLKADWGREPWQDFELLQSNVPGPGCKGFAGGSEKGGAAAKASTGDGERGRDPTLRLCGCRLGRQRFPFGWVDEGF